MVACQYHFESRALLQKLVGFQGGIQSEVLRRLHQMPQVSQCALANDLSVGLGTINFCFQALVEKGWLTMQNFNQSKNKLRYVYLLTPGDREIQADGGVFETVRGGV